MSYSVLMSVYYKENPTYFVDSVNSMLDQTVAPEEIIIVKDGKLTPELEDVCKRLELMYQSIRFVPLENNVGLGKALDVGLLHCKNEYVARMDTDDISVESRCEKMLHFLEENVDIAIVGSYISEFENETSNIVGQRIVPSDNSSIAKYMRQRSPFNHPSVMFRKSAILNVGSYQKWYLNEDYYLWVRLYLSDYKFANITESLLYMRISEDTYKRRAGWKYFLSQKQLFDFMLDNKIINIFEYIYNNAVRFIRMLMPNCLRSFIYSNVLRSK